MNVFTTAFDGTVIVNDSSSDCTTGHGDLGWPANSADDRKLPRITTVVRPLNPSMNSGRILACGLSAFPGARSQFLALKAFAFLASPAIEYCRAVAEEGGQWTQGNHFRVPWLNRAGTRRVLQLEMRLIRFVLTCGMIFDHRAV